MNQEVAESTNDGREWAMLCHLAGFLGWVFPLGGIIVPLVLWLMKKREYPLVNQAGKESLNFQLSYAIYTIVFALLIIGTPGIVVYFSNALPADVLWGIYIIMALVMALVFASTNMICMIVAAIRTYKGKSFRYPLTIRFIK